MDSRLAKRFGKVIKKHRNNRGLSQEELAFDTGLHRTYISLLERGIRQPTLSVIFLLSDSLNCEPEQLVKEAK